MFTQNEIAVTLLSTSVLNSTSTVSGASVDLGPYFNVMRREVMMVASWVKADISTAGSETISFHLEEDSSTSSANSTSTTMTGIVGSSWASTYSTTVRSDGLQYLYVPITKRYVRAVLIGTAATSTGTPAFGVTIGLVLERRSA